MTRWLGKNLSLIVMSILLAFFFWMVAIEATDPTQEKVFPAAIPVEIVGLPETMIIYAQDATAVAVELRAPQSVWVGLDKNNLTARINLSTITTTTIRVPVEVAINATPTRLLSVRPSEITLNVEPLVQRAISVNLKIEGDVALGYKMDVPIIKPLVVKLKGPQSFVEQVTTAQTQISLDNQQTTIWRTSTLSARNSADQAVAHVEVLPDAVSVHIPVSPLGQIRDLAVNPAIVGQPAPGYSIANIKTLPQIAKVYGPPSYSPKQWRSF